MLNCCHSRQEDARGKGSKLTCGELARIFFFFFFLCRLSDSVGPSGKLLQPRGRRSKREGESWVAKRRSQISQWLHGVMYLWSAAMDCNPRSLLYILPLLLSCVIPAFPIIYPPNEGKRTLSLRTCVFTRMCAHARACAGRSPQTVRFLMMSWCEARGGDAEDRRWDGILSPTGND